MFQLECDNFITISHRVNLSLLYTITRLLQNEIIADSLVIELPVTILLNIFSKLNQSNIHLSFYADLYINLF